MNRATRGENLSVGKDSRPLADRMRPEHIAALVGQEHLLGAGKPLRVAIESGRLHSMVLWGPPGTGKTTVARLLAQQRLGSPEGELTLAQAIVYLACAPKSNAVYRAFNAAFEDARALGSLEVPLHLRNAPARLLAGLNYGKGYRYAHDEPEAYAAGQCYFPQELT